MASVTKREGSPLYQASYYIDGKRFRFTTESRNRRDAQREADAAEQQAKLAVANSGGLKLVDASQMFFEVNSKIKPKTVKDYKRALANVYGWKGDFFISSITSDDVKSYVSIRLQEGAGTVTVRRELAFMSSLYTLASTWENRLSANVWKDYNKKALKNATERTSYLSHTDVDKMLASCKSQLHRTLFILGVDTGMRRMEILRLHKDELDLKRGLILLGNRDRFRTKTSTGREIPLNQRCVDAIVSLIKSQQDNTKNEWNGYLFENRSTGKPITDVKTWWRALCKRAGIPAGREQGIVFHDLRHTFATHGLMAGADETSLMGITGHKSKQSFKRYAHATTQSKRRAIELMERHNKVTQAD